MTSDPSPAHVARAEPTQGNAAVTASNQPLPVILLVDDADESRAILLDAVDHRYGHDYDVTAEPSAADAMRRLEDLRGDGRPVAMIVADHWMPGETGASLLARSRRLHPTAQRLLLTDWGDFTAVDATVQSIILGEIETWVARPFGHADEEFHTVITTALARWTHESDRAGVALTIVGDPWDSAAGVLRDAFARLLLPFAFRDAATPEGRALLQEAGIDGPLPVVILADGRVLVQPGQSDVAAALGMQEKVGEGRVDVAVIGGGPAGLAAAVYGASEGLTVTVIESTAIGGQASSSPMMRNYLGFPAGVTGGELTARALQQAITFGAKFVFGRTATALRADGEDLLVTIDDGSELRAGAIVVATGVSYRRMGIERLEALVGRGIFYGSGTSEARGVEGERVYVVGGANSAGSAAMHLARHAAHVTVLVRGGSLVDTMSDYLVRELDNADNVDVRLNTEIVDVVGDFRLEGLVLRDRTTGAIEEVPAAAAFILIGAAPHTAWLPAEVARDDHGFILTGEQRPDSSDGLSLATTMPGVFAAGDARLNPVKRVAAAVGDGSTAIRQVHEYRSQRQRAATPA
jgi:thioredoxin reductase (NADPH)